jgi:serine/threonine protein kinase
LWQRWGLKGGAARRGRRLAMGATGSIEYTIGEPMRGTKWVVRGKLGQGGMGLVLDVVKADLIPGAMKVLLPPFANAPEFAAKFLDEVKVTARLQHPNVVQVLDFDRLEGGMPFMVMERLRGRTLRAALREIRQGGKAWTPGNAYAVAAQIAQGLYRAHTHAPSIVHRDVKPENVFLHRTEGSFESVVKVMDFGVAAVVGERDLQRIGTPRYMAPEQVTGDPVSPQTDQYALALVVYEMLTERFPWDVDLRNSSALAEVHRGAAPVPPSVFCPWLPRRVDAAILKALAKDPAARHDTVHGLMFELRWLQAIDSRSTSVTGDSNTTEPMVGTLADGGAVVREEHDTFDRMPAPSLHGPSLVVPEPSVPSDAVGGPSELWEPWERSADAQASAPREPTPRERLDPASNPLPATRGAPAKAAVRPEAPDARSTLALGPLDTPMTGESGRPAEDRSDRKASPTTARRAAFALIGSTAVVATLVSLRMAGSSRESTTRGKPTANAPAVAEAAPQDLGSEPLANAVDEPSVAGGPTATPSFVPAWEPDFGPTTGPQPDAGSASAAVRKVPPPPAPAPTRGGAPTKVPVPDDGRNELYIPEPR